MTENKRFSGHIGNEPFEGTLEEWACRVGGTVTGPNTISIDLNKPTPFGKPTALEPATFNGVSFPAPRVRLLAPRETPALNAACVGAVYEPVLFEAKEEA